MAVQQQHVLVYYHVPSDQDDGSIPNAFAMPLQAGCRDLKLKELRKSFPLPGTYHFRFKMRVEGPGDGRVVWMDITNGESNLPRFDDHIVSKVLRLSWQDTGATNGTASSSSDANASPARGPSAAKQASRSVPLNSHSSPAIKGTLLDGMSTPTAAKPPAPSIASGMTDLFGQQAPSSSPPTASTPPQSNTSAQKKDELGDMFDLFK